MAFSLGAWPRVSGLALFPPLMGTFLAAGVRAGEWERWLQHSSWLRADVPPDGRNPSREAPSLQGHPISRGGLESRGDAASPSLFLPSGQRLKRAMVQMAALPGSVLPT